MNLFNRKTFPLATIMQKMFVANSSFHVKQRTTRKFQFLFFSSFLLVWIKFLFWEDVWPLGYSSMKFWDFPDFFSFLKFFWVVRQIVRQLGYTMFIANNHTSFHLRWKENLVKYQKVLKYYVHGCNNRLI